MSLLPIPTVHVVHIEKYFDNNERKYNEISLELLDANINKKKLKCKN